MTASPQRRSLRSPRHTAALGMLLLATAGVCAALAVRAVVPLGLAAVAAAVLGWGAVAMLRDELVRARVQHARDRADVARGYRVLFAARTADHADFVATMSDRLARERAERTRAEEALVEAERRAGAAELGLARAGHRIVVLEHRLLDLTVEARSAAERLEAREREVAELRRNRPPAPAFPVEEAVAAPAPVPVAVPEWTDPRWIQQLDPDPAAALLAWEAHVRSRTQVPRHRKHA